MREPEQIDRHASDMRSLARRHGAIERRGKDRTDQISDLRVQQPGEFAVVEMAGGHQPQALRLLLVRHIRYPHEMPDHAPDQFDQRGGRWLLPEQMRQTGIGLAFSARISA